VIAMQADIQPDTLWWGMITGPTRYVRAIVESILSNSSALLQDCDAVPWPSELFHKVENCVKEDDGFLLFYRKDCSDSELAQINPAKYLLNEFASRDIAEGYSSATGTSTQEYLIKNQVLRGKVVWLSSLSRDAIVKWSDFIKGYRSKSCHDGVLVIEGSGHSSAVTKPKRILYKDFVSEYDALVFANVFASSLGYSEEWKGYIAHLAVHLLASDIENYESFITSSDFLTGEPDELVNCTHSVEDAEKRVWEAQIEKLFSLVERERIVFIEKYSGAIREALGTEYWDDKAGCCRKLDYELGDDIFSLELGPVYRMTYLRCGNDRTRHLLNLQSESALRRLKLLRDMRNNLAHVSKCSLDQVKELLAEH
jgi:hypothetical protein